MQGPYLRKYGVAATIDFQLFEIDGVDFRVDAVHAAGDTKVMKDEGAEANTTNSFTDEGSGYSIVLPIAEMQAARVVVCVIDQTATKAWLDTALVIETYGNASAMHAFDLDTASTAQTGDSFARLGAPAGASVSADIVVIEGQTDDIGVAGAGLTAINLPNQTMDITGDITGNLSGSVGSVSGHTVQTGDSYAVVNHADHGNAKLVRSTTPANTLDVDASHRVDVGEWLGTAVTSGTGGPDVNLNAVSDDTTAAATLELFVEKLNQSTGQLDNGSYDATLDTYAARVELYDDDVGTSDRYTCKWYKNGELVKSGITVPKIQVIKDSDGTDLIADTAMTEVGSRGVFKYVATGAERITSGATYGVSVTATIGGATRTDEKDIGRDT